MKAKIELEPDVGTGCQSKLPTQPEDGWLTTRAAADRLHVTGGTLLKWGKTGKLPYAQLERKVLWHWPSVEQALLRLQRCNGNGGA
jgi:hypothetical protein